jgi:type II secretory pathway pseudopilin PulG
LVVLTLIAALAAIVVGAGRRALEAGRVARAQAELAALAAALEAYRLHHGDYPRTGDHHTLVQALLGRLDPTGTVIEPAGRAWLELSKFGLDPAAVTAATAVELLDPWGQPYRYAYRTLANWTNSSFVLHSHGPDGAGASALAPGGYFDDGAAENADNVVANRL